MVRKSTIAGPIDKAGLKMPPEIPFPMIIEAVKVSPTPTAFNLNTLRASNGIRLKYEKAITKVNSTSIIACCENVVDVGGCT